MLPFQVVTCFEGKMMRYQFQSYTRSIGLAGAVAAESGNAHRKVLAINPIHAVDSPDVSLT